MTLRLGKCQILNSYVTEFLICVERTIRCCFFYIYLCINRLVCSILDKEQNFNFTTPKEDLESGPEWGMGQVGTSLHIVPKISANDVQEVLLGAPGARMWSGE